MGDWRVEAVRMKAMCKNDLPCAVISQAHTHTHIRSHLVINYALKMRSLPPLFYHFTQVSFVPAKVIVNFTLTHLKIETRQKRKRSVQPLDCVQSRRRATFNYPDQRICLASAPLTHRDGRGSGFD